MLPAYSQLADKPLQSPPNKAQDAARFMRPPVTATPAAARFAGYEKRLQLEAASPFSQIRWRSVGPEIQSGRIIDIESPADDPKTVMVAFATGGLWRTRDEGNTWESLFDGQMSFGIGDFAVSRDGKTIWVGTGENNSQRTVYSGTGVYRSTDAGKTWKHMGLPESHHIGRVVMDPRNPNTVYVASMGPLYSSGGQRGVFKTTDGGATWRQIWKGDATTGSIELAMDPRDSNVLYMSSWDRERRAWNFRDGGPGSALWKTTDGGRTWRPLTNGFPAAGDLGRIGISVCKGRPNTVYAFVDNQGKNGDWRYEDEQQPGGILTVRRFLNATEEQFLAFPRPVLESFWNRLMPSDVKLDDALAKLKDKSWTLEDVAKAMERRNPNVFNVGRMFSELYRSDDAGKTWRRTHPQRLGEHGGYYWGKVVVNPHDPDDVFTLGVILLRSKDGGRTWNPVARRAHVDFHDIWFDPKDKNRIWLGNDGGPYVSGDNGETWRNVNNLPVGQFTTIAVDMKTPYNIYGGLQDNGTMRGPSSYVPGRSDPNQWSSIGGGDGSWISVDPRDNGDVVYIASQFGAHSAWNQRTNERWSTRARAAQGEPPLRYNWISPLVISPHHPDIVYLGSQRLHRSLNMGRNWEAISPDLTKNRPNGDVPHSTIKDISESPFKFGRIVVGTDDGRVWITHDHGNTWQNIDTPSPDKWVCRVIASKYFPNRIYVAQTGYREDDFRPYLWRSDDLGKTWTSIVGNLPEGEPINVVREDPNRNDVLYLGTDLGVWIQFAGGDWEPLSGGIPRTPVHDLVVHPRENEIVIASHARSVWILPLAKIHTITPAMRKQGLTLTVASPSLRREATWGYARREEWDTRPAEAPTVRGEFWSPSSGQGTLRLRDKDGKVVLEEKIEAAVGFNFWDLSLELTPGRPLTVDVRSQKVTDPLADPRQAERPTYPPVGDYTLELEVGGTKATVPFKITG